MLGGNIWLTEFNMKLQLHSDLHLEGFSAPVPDLFNAYIIPEKNAWLVLAGDIFSGKHFDRLTEFLTICTDKFEKVLYVLGNHEAYGTSLQAVDEYHDKLAFSNLWHTGITDVKVFTEHPEFKFILGTFWADGGKQPLDSLAVYEGLNDFKKIDDFASKFSVRDMKRLHEKQQTLFDIALSAGTKKNVCITHHLPSRELVHPRFKHWGDGINGGFASDSDHLIEKADFWLHGHTHDRIETALHGCKIYCNPTGYVSEYRNATIGGRPMIIDLGE
jgi:predicted phosphodiesterase